MHKTRVHCPTIANATFETVYVCKALGLGVQESAYLLYSNRSGVRLSLQDKEGCLDDALLAVKHAPKGFTTVWM